MKTSESSRASAADSGTTVIKKKSALPLWAAAAVWVVAGLFLPMYRPLHYVIIAAVSVAAAVVAFIFDPGYDEYIKKPEVRTGNADVDTLCTEISKTEKHLRQLVVLMPVDKAAVSSRLEKICVTLEKICSDLREDPDDLRSCRRIMNYYLPLTDKLADKYSFLLRQAQGIASDGSSSLSELSEKIENAFTDIDASLRKQLDALYSNDEIDISTDIDVMNEMLRRSGIE